MARRSKKGGSDGAAQRVPGIGLGILLRDAYRAFTRTLEAELARHEVTHREWVHLWYIWEADGEATANYVSRRAGIQKASSTAALHSLEARGLIERARDPEDSRRVKLLLTAAGNAKMKELLKCALGVNRRARGMLSDSKTADLFASLAAIAGNLAGGGAPGNGTRAAKTEGARDGAAKA